MLRVLDSTSYIKMPWKNGLGITEEIIRYPLYSTEYDWRLSRAKVSNNGKLKMLYGDLLISIGPFSLFKNYDRHIAILKGSDMTLHVGSNPEVKLTAQSPPFAFSGDSVTFAIISDPIIGLIDFNFLVKRGSYDHEVLRMKTNCTTIPKKQNVSHLIYLNRGELKISSNSEHVNLKQEDTCYIESSSNPVNILSLCKDIDYFIINLYKI